MDQLFAAQFWQEVIARAPWVIPSFLLGGLVGWKWKGANDDGEIRGLQAEVRGVRAELGVAAQRLELARERYEAVVNQVNELRRIVAEQDKVITELKKVPAATARVGELLTFNREIKNALTKLSTSTSNLGEALTFIHYGSGQSTLPSASPTIPPST